MGSTVRRISGARVAGLAALAAILVAGVAPGAGAQSSSPSPVDGTGLQSIGACLSRTPNLIVAVVVDESASLTQSDPDALRVPAIRAALGSLLSLTRRSGSGGSVDVELQVNGFSSGFETRSPWTQLNEGSLAGLLTVAEEFRGRDQGAETDYVLALEGANEALAVRAAELAAGGTETCKALLWFTDGGYDISNAAFGSKPYAQGVGGEEAAALGERRLCDADGVADRLRRNGVVNVAIGLNAGDLADLGLLRRIAVGGSCGNFESPDVMGSLLGVSDVNLLTSAMLEAITGSAGRPAGNAEVCGALPCQRTIKVEIPEGVGSFYLLTTATGEQIQRWVKAPDESTPVLIQPGSGSSTLGSSSFDSLQLSASTVMVDVDLDDQSPATGTWEVSFVDPGGGAIGELATAEVYLFGALTPRFPEDPVFRAGEPTTIDISIVDAAGNTVTGPLAGDTTLAMSVGDPVTGKVTRLTPAGPNGDGQYSFEYLAGADSTAAALNVTAALSVVLEDGIALRPVVVERAIPIKVPVVVPSLATDQLRLGGIEGVVPARGVIEVSGPERGEGEACVRAWTSRSLPEGVPTVDLVESSNCVMVAAGASATLDVALRPAGSGTGTASGVVEVELLASDGSEQVLRSIPASFEMQRAVDQGRRWLVFVVMMLLGIGVPLGGFILVSRALTRLPEPGTIMWAEVPVEIRNGVMTRRPDPEGPVTFIHSDWNYLPGGSPRQASLGSGVTVAVNHRPFGTSDAGVRSGGEVIGSLGSRRRWGSPEGQVPLELARSWALVVDGMDLPASDGMGATDSEPQASDVVVTARLVAFMDDRYEWLARSRDVAIEAAAAAPDRLESAVKDYLEQRRSGSAPADGGGDMPVGVGAGIDDPFATSSDAAIPGWDDTPPPKPGDWSTF